MLVLGAACSSAPAEPEGTPDELLEDELNFFGNSVREYILTGESSVEIEPEFAAKSPSVQRRRALELVKLKNMQIAWFLSQFLVEKDPKDKNKDYGGMGGLVGFGSEPETDVRDVGNRVFRFKYSVTAAGGRDLISKIDGESAGNGKKKFRLSMGRVTNEELAQLELNKEWYQRSPWKAFDPSQLPADRLELIDLTIEESPRSADAFLAYDRLYEDGQLSVAVHFGYDYHARFDVSGSRELYRVLTEERGFVSPVRSYNEYLRTSGPLTRAITSNGKPIEVKLWIYHPGEEAKGVPGPDPDTNVGGVQLESDMRASFRDKEVVIFSGHSGPTYGFALANWKKTEEGDLDDSKIPGLTMPSSYQIVMADGCDTYGLGAAFWKVPSKANQKNLNVITTTSFSNAGTLASTLRMIDAVTNQTAGRVTAQTMSQLTRGFDRDQGSDFYTMYGVHGLDNNPKYDPLARRSSLCSTCRTNADCGGDGNRCTRISSSVTACTYGCSADEGCPSGYQCKAVGSATSQTVKSRQCVPISRKCGG